MANTDELRQRVLRYGDQLASQTVDLLMQELHDAAPVSGDSTGGHMRDMITAQRESDSPHVAYRIVSPAPQSEWTEEGTTPHLITPRGSGYPLKFFWPKVGKVVRFPYVNHPGNAAKPWFRPTLANWSDRLQLMTQRVSI